MKRIQGDHTWDIIVDYHRCPACGFIQESRQPYAVEGDILVKQLTCERCDGVFKATKARKKSFAPLFGSRQPAEFDWS
jgi:uncharacterized C2H2 Zn-finger protein